MSIRIEQEIIDVGKVFEEKSEGIVHRKTIKNVQFRRRGIRKYNIRKGVAVLNPWFKWNRENIALDVVRHVKKEVEVDGVKEG